MCTEGMRIIAGKMGTIIVVIVVVALEGRYATVERTSIYRHGLRARKCSCKSWISSPKAYHRRKGSAAMHVIDGTGTVFFFFFEEKRPGD